MDPDLYRSILRRHAAGVVVITVAGRRPAGFTATSFTSVSLRPPLVSFCVDVGSSTWPALSAAEHVGVHMVSQSQEGLARRFAEHDVDRFGAPTRWEYGPHGVPVLDGVLAVLICGITSLVTAGDHVIVLAEPIQGDHRDDAGAALVYHMGRYLSARRISRPSPSARPALPGPGRPGRR